MHARFTDLRRKLRVNRKAIEEPVDLLDQLVRYRHYCFKYTIDLYCGLKFRHTSTGTVGF